MSDKEKQRLIASGDVISLIEASKLTPYSVEYLSLLARKQRIPAFKFSRDWLTTRQAVLEYAKEQLKKKKQLIARFELAKQDDRHEKESI
jgi:hypothetical protein